MHHSLCHSWASCYFMVSCCSLSWLLIHFWAHVSIVMYPVCKIVCDFNPKVFSGRHSQNSAWRLLTIEQLAGYASTWNSGSVDLWNYTFHFVFLLIVELIAVKCVMSGPYQRLLLVKDKLTMSSIEKIVDTFVVDEWSSIARLYDAVVQFARVYKGQTSASVETSHSATSVYCFD